MLKFKLYSSWYLLNVTYQTHLRFNLKVLPVYLRILACFYCDCIPTMNVSSQLNNYA